MEAGGDSFTWRHAGAVAAVLSLATVLLRLLGRNWWCQARDFRVWSSDIVSLHNSQHLLDPYTLTHVLHGIGFYALLWLALRHRDRLFRGVVAVALESGWEVVENTGTVIERFREDTVSLGYYGDSIVNSLGDVVACGLGYALAMLLPTGASVAGFLAVEATLLVWIRDSLLLNIVMLVHPIEAVKNWQLGP